MRRQKEKDQRGRAASQQVSRLDSDGDGGLWVWGQGRWRTEGTMRQTVGTLRTDKTMSKSQLIRRWRFGEAQFDAVSKTPSQPTSWVW
jgi:hypothetical protein